MKGLWLILVAGSLLVTPVVGNSFEDFWANDKDFFGEINDKIEESNKTESPTSQPTMKPTRKPTAAPTKSPSHRPSSSPTESAAPSNQPSFPPSALPSIFPTMSSKPSSQPSAYPTISAKPSFQPSMSPTTSAKPSTSPTLSTSPSAQPSTEPTSSSAPSSEPSLSPTTTNSPSSPPSAQPSISSHPTLTTKPSSQPIIPSSGPRSNPSDEPSSVPSQAPSKKKLITTRIILNSDSTRKNLIAVGAVSLLLMASAVAYVSKSSIQLKGNDFHKFPGLQPSISIQSSDEPEQHENDASNPLADFVAQNYSTNGQEDHADTDMKDIDLEDGRAGIQAEDSVDESSVGLNSLPYDVKGKGVSIISKIFKRRPIETGTQGTSWMEIRDEGSPACSSGCEPAKKENSVSSLSPRFSPFVFSRSFNDNDNVECVFCEKEDLGVQDFNRNTTIVKRKELLGTSSISNGIQDRTIHTDTDSVCSSIFSGLGESSAVAPDASRQSIEQNMNQLKNILGTIKSLGSYEDSLISASSGGTSAQDFKNRAKARLGLNQGQVYGHQSASGHVQWSLPSQRTNISRPDNITYKKELLSTAGGHCDGINFNKIVSDPRNDVYECNAPSGPLGIFVEATKVGLRVQRINPMSPLCNTISVGDIIIAVDEVDTVGMETGAFWKLVSRRASKQQRCFVVLRI